MGTNTRLAARYFSVAPRGAALLAAGLLLRFSSRVYTLLFESSHCQGLYSQAAPGFQSTAGVLKSAKHLTVFGLFRIALSKRRGEKRKRKKEKTSIFSAHVLVASKDIQTTDL